MCVLIHKIYYFILLLRRFMYLHIFCYTLSVLLCVFCCMHIIINRGTQNVSTSVKPLRKLLIRTPLCTLVFRIYYVKVLKY